MLWQVRHGRKARGPNTDALEEAISLAQHHDAVTGTAKQHVADDYNMRIDAGDGCESRRGSSVCLQALCCSLCIFKLRLVVIS